MRSRNSVMVSHVRATPISIHICSTNVLSTQPLDDSFGTGPFPSALVPFEQNGKLASKGIYSYPREQTQALLASVQNCSFRRL
jgi:hypothetical protein